MNFAVLVAFLCSVVLLVVAQDGNMVINATKADHDHKEGMDHSGHDHTDGMDHSSHDGVDHSHDHDSMTSTATTNMPSTNNNSSVKDPSAQGSTTGGAVQFSACVSLVLLAAALPRLV